MYNVSYMLRPTLPSSRCVRGKPPAGAQQCARQRGFGSSHAGLDAGAGLGVGQPRWWVLGGASFESKLVNLSSNDVALDVPPAV
jgi:hypothetical protein